MKNYLRPGHSRQFTASGTVASGGVVTFNAGAGGSVGVSKDAYTNGQTGEAQISGVHILPKVAATAIAAGVKVYWDGSVITSTASTNTPAGECHADAATNDATIAVLLNGRPGPNLH